MKLLKTHHLLINSANRNEGIEYDFTVHFDHGLKIRTDNKDERIKISLLKFSAYVDFYMVRPGETDTITFINHAVPASPVYTTITIPEGTYKYVVLAAQITTLYPACTCSYNSRLNKFQFDFATNHTLIFPSEAYKILGFSASGWTTPTTSISSTTRLRVKPYDNILISLFGVSPMAETFDNNKVVSGQPGKYLQQSNILACILANNPPNTITSWDAQTHTGLDMWINDRSINKLRFVLTDEGMNPLTYLKNECIMILKVEIWDTRENDEAIVKELMKLSEYNKLSFISNNLSK